MYIITGGTGHIGKALSAELLERKEDVLIITHNPDKPDEIAKSGARSAIVDVNDTNKLNQVYRKGNRLFVLNPPADPSRDMVAEEFKSVQSILSAISDSGAEKIVVASTYGTQPGHDIGDLGVLHELERGIASSGMSHAIIRSAYYYTNWDMSLDTAINEGKIYTFFPPDFRLPMVAPADIAKLAAQLLTGSVNQTGLHYCAGPEDYSPNDVAAAFGKALGKPVEAVEIPRETWEETMMQVGFSEKSAKSMANMTAITLEDDYEKPDNPYRGTITIEEYISGLVNSRQ